MKTNRLETEIHRLTDKVIAAAKDVARHPTPSAYASFALARARLDADFLRLAEEI